MKFGKILISIIMGSIIGGWIVDAAFNIQRAIAYLAAGHPGGWQPALHLLVIVTCIMYLMVKEAK